MTENYKSLNLQGESIDDFIEIFMKKNNCNVLDRNVNTKELRIKFGKTGEKEATFVVRWNEYLAL